MVLQTSFNVFSSLARKPGAQALALIMHMALLPIMTGCTKKGAATSANLQSIETNDLPLAIFDPTKGSPRTAKNIFQLVDHGYEDTIGLNDLLKSLTQKGLAHQFMTNYLKFAGEAIGLKINMPNLDAELIHPDLLTDKLQIDVKTADAGRRAILAALKTLPPQPMHYGYQLPNPFDFSKSGELKLNIPDIPLREIVPGVFAGLPHDPDYPMDQLRQNIMLSEVIERLSVNQSLTPKNAFTVIYRSKPYTSLASFTHALTDNGHKITADLQHMVALFTLFYAKKEDGKLYPIAAPLFDRTGFKDAAGVEAVLPALHSEIQFEITPGSETLSDPVVGKFVYYQGALRTGFYCNGCLAIPKWAGLKVTDRFTTEESPRALTIAGRIVNMIREISRDEKLWFDGYGATGVCNDSAAMVQAAIHRKVDSYPLLMVDEWVLPQLDKRLADTKDKPELADEFNDLTAIYQAIKLSPSDIEPNNSTRARALLSIPWEQGEEPFVSLTDARRILSLQAN